ncbi:hypothetical protein BCR34DRAFT_588157 [Clohesyomyces aquaticus]|uniref:Uncharacterized protein n=1 Tax=Clohesyomyces aquaticus TaxID=1231657 RepID=A0A1Y1ZLA7_9PLEO|nr:hypothetical protein BCR34DRAFT_588157 [Clohesyomyces aquaticus]
MLDTGGRQETPGADSGLIHGRLSLRWLMGRSPLSGMLGGRDWGWLQATRSRSASLGTCFAVFMRLSLQDTRHESTIRQAAGSGRTLCLSCVAASDCENTYSARRLAAFASRRESASAVNVDGQKGRVARQTSWASASRSRTSLHTPGPPGFGFNAATGAEQATQSNDCL